MIEEQIIDQVAQTLSDFDEEQFTHAVLDFEKNHPVVLGYIFSENMSLLTDDEQSLLLYMMMVIRHSYINSNEGKDVRKVDEEEIVLAEERNWAIYGEPGGNFQKRLNVFFEDTPQEDLLAFIEDMLADDEEEIATKAGREFIFIAAKTMVDIWC